MGKLNSPLSFFTDNLPYFFLSIRQVSKYALTFCNLYKEPQIINAPVSWSTFAAFISIFQQNSFFSKYWKHWNRLFVAKLFKWYLILKIERILMFTMTLSMTQKSDQFSCQEISCHKRRDFLGS